MKTVFVVFRFLLVFFIILHFISTLVEYDLAKRTFHQFRKDLNSLNKKEFSSCDEIISISLNGIKYTYKTYEQRLVLEIIVITLIVINALLRRRVRRI